MSDNNSTPRAMWLTRDNAPAFMAELADALTNDGDSGCAAVVAEDFYVDLVDALEQMQAALQARDLKQAWSAWSRQIDLVMEITDAPDTQTEAS